MLIFTMLRGLCVLWCYTCYSSISGVFSPVPDYVKVTIDTVIAIHKQEPHGDVLAFLTGQVRLYVCHPVISMSCVYVCVCVHVHVCVCTCVCACV